jgi:RNA polymerase sigma factor (sigma-70 family)
MTNVESSWPDSKLVEQCLEGNERAWAAMVERYKNLIYSLAVRSGFNQDDATDIFQSVAAQLLSELPRLRQPEALAAWLIKVTVHRCSQLKKVRAREDRLWQSILEELPEPVSDHSPESGLDLDQRRRVLRQALECSSPRCRRLIEMLFFETPPRPYPEVAASLGLATGSIGFIRRRCLDQLRSALEQAGF